MSNDSVQVGLRRSQWEPGRAEELPYTDEGPEMAGNVNYRRLLLQFRVFLTILTFVRVSADICCDIARAPSLLLNTIGGEYHPCVAPGLSALLKVTLSQTQLSLGPSENLSLRSPKRAAAVLLTTSNPLENARKVFACQEKGRLCAQGEQCRP